MKGEYTPQEKAGAIEDFNQFIFMMDDVLEPFIEQAQEAGFNLDYSLESLNHLEEYAIKLDAKPLSDFHGQASQYLGELMSKCFDYTWELSLDMKENSLYYGKPVLASPLNNGVQFAPYSITRNFLIRRIRGMLKNAVFNHIQHQPLDLSHLPTEDE